MHIEHHQWFSNHLGHDMHFKVYGHFGQPILVFPAQDGRFHDYEGFKMIEACKEFIKAGRVKFICIDSVDWQTWTNKGAHPADRARRHGDYEKYVINEIVPWVQNNTGLSTIWTTGCSMGALHATNFFLKRPDVFDGLIALSGLYSMQSFIGEYGDDNTFYNSPLQYLPNLSDPWYLEYYRRAKIVFAVGQGNWEVEAIADTQAMQQLLASKNVPAWFDYWGYDVPHDWTSWRNMMPYFLEKIL
jgi:esterase/lipase superfamily enzyme